MFGDFNVGQSEVSLNFTAGASRCLGMNIVHIEGQDYQNILAEEPSVEPVFGWKY